MYLLFKVKKFDDVRTQEAIERVADIARGLVAITIGGPGSRDPFLPGDRG